MASSKSIETDLKAEIDKLRSEIETLKERLDIIEGHPEIDTRFRVGESKDGGPNGI